MANLLPIKERKRGQREYTLRLSAVILIFFITAVVFGSVLLLPSYFFAELKLKSVKEQSVLVQRAIELRGQDVSGVLLTGTKQKLIELDTAQTQISQITLINAVNANRGQGIMIRSYFYTYAKDENSIKIFGTASTREALTSFSERLKQESLFSRIDLPVSSLAKDTNIDFSITLFGDF
jgi:hypothetical protein